MLVGSMGVAPASPAPASATGTTGGVKSVSSAACTAGHGVPMPNAGSLRMPPAWPALPPPPVAPPVPPIDVPAALVPAAPTGEPALPPVAGGSASSVTQPRENKKSEAHRPAPIGKKDRFDFMVVLLPARHRTDGCCASSGKI